MEKPSYYSIIPASVRYDKRLTANAKLLYAEITALTNMNGQCFATNDYFSKLYGVSKQSISSWIKNLVDCGYIKSEIIYKEGSKEIDKRYLTFLYDPIKENFNTPHQENFKDNNNNIFNNNLTDSNNIANDTKCNQMLANATGGNKLKLGELGNVSLTDEQYKTLSARYSNIDDAIEVLDTWLGTSGGKYKNKNHFAYFKSNSWVWERVENKKTSIMTKKEQTVFIEDGKFYIDSTMQEYKDVLVGMDDVSVENCWKWIYNNFYGQEVSVEFVRERLKQFKRTEE